MQWKSWIFEIGNWMIFSRFLANNAFKWNAFSYSFLNYFGLLLITFCKFKVVRRKSTDTKTMLEIRKPVTVSTYQNIARNMQLIYKGASSTIKIKSVYHLCFHSYVCMKNAKNSRSRHMFAIDLYMLLLRIATNK